MSLRLIFFRLTSYLKYFWNSQNSQKLHSHWLFQWYEGLSMLSASDGDKIAIYRRNLVANNDTIMVDGNPKLISSRYKTTSISHTDGLKLYNTIKYIEAKNILELGTSLGVSAAYMSLNEIVTAISLDREVDSQEFVKQCWDALGMNPKFRFQCGDFESTLKDALESINTVDFCFIDGAHTYKDTIVNTELILSHLSNNSVIILDDIRWSGGMYKAWDELRMKSDFNYTVDFGRMGFLFKIDNNSPKQHFILR